MTNRRSRLAGRAGRGPALEGPGRQWRRQRPLARALPRPFSSARRGPSNWRLDRRTGMTNGARQLVTQSPRSIFHPVFTGRSRTRMAKVTSSSARYSTRHHYLPPILTTALYRCHPSRLFPSQEASSKGTVQFQRQNTTAAAPRWRTHTTQPCPPSSSTRPTTSTCAPPP